MPNDDRTIKLIRQYKELLDSGAITQEEFDRKKAELLSYGGSTDEYVEEDGFYEYYDEEYDEPTYCYRSNIGNEKINGCFTKAAIWAVLGIGAVLVALYIIGVTVGGVDPLVACKSAPAESITEATQPTELDEYDAESSYTLSTGEVLEVIENERDGMKVMILKAKIDSQLTNDLTVRQNYHNVCNLINDQGCDRFDEIQYWAVVDMRDGSEQKVISFTLNKQTIQGIKDGSILPIELEPYLDDLWIHPSLLSE